MFCLHKSTSFALARRTSPNCCGTGRLPLSLFGSHTPVRVSFMHRISRMSNGNCGDRLLIQEAPLLIIEASANNDILFAVWPHEERRNLHRGQYLQILTTRTCCLFDARRLPELSFLFLGEFAAAPQIYFAVNKTEAQAAGALYSLFCALRRALRSLNTKNTRPMCPVCTN